MLRWAEFLEGVPRRDFSMFVWGVGRDDGMPECGTLACALGYACAVPEFREAGLRYDNEDRITYRGRYYSDAGCKFFGLSVQQGIDLFHAPNSKDITPQQKAAQIRSMAASEL